MVNTIYQIGISDRNYLLAYRFYAQKFPDAKHPGYRLVKNLKARFEANGSVMYEKVNRRKPNIAEDNELNVVMLLVEDLLFTCEVIVPYQKKFYV